MKERLINTTSKVIPYTFSRSSIKKILNQFWVSEKYLNNDWGDFMRHRDIIITACMYGMALRPAEACQMKFTDINWKSAYYNIRPQTNKRHKGRAIPIPQDVLKLVKNYLMRFSRERFWKGSDYLFPSYQNNYISTKRYEYTLREKILKPLGLWEPASNGKVSRTRPYTLRHSRASHILARQIKETGNPDIYSIANILGHSDIRSTTIYLHTDKNYLKYLRCQMEL